MKYETPTPEMLAALQRFADKHGRNWKRALSDMWMDGRDERQDDAHLLRTARNHFGPTWLYDRCKIKPAPKGKLVKRVTVEQAFTGRILR